MSGGTIHAPESHGRQHERRDRERPRGVARRGDERRVEQRNHQNSSADRASGRRPSRLRPERREEHRTPSHENREESPSDPRRRPRGDGNGHAQRDDGQRGDAAARTFERVAADLFAREVREDGDVRGEKHRGEDKRRRNGFRRQRHGHEEVEAAADTHAEETGCGPFQDAVVEQNREREHGRDHDGGCARAARKRDSRGQKGRAEPRGDCRRNGPRGNRALWSLGRIHFPIEVVVEGDSAEVETGRSRDAPEPGIARGRARLAREDEPGERIGDSGEDVRRPEELEHSCREALSVRRRGHAAGGTIRWRGATPAPRYAGGRAKARSFLPGRNWPAPVPTKTIPWAIAGPPAIAGPAGDSQRSSPSAALQARSFPSVRPRKTTPPATESGPSWNAGRKWSQWISPLPASRAATAHPLSAWLLEAKKTRPPAAAVGPASGPVVGRASHPAGGRAGVSWTCQSLFRVSRSHARMPSLPPTTRSHFPLRSRRSIGGQFRARFRAS